MVDGVETLKLSSNKGSYVGQIAKIAGYGFNSIPVETDEKTGDVEEGIGFTDDKLKYLNVTVVDNSECTRSYNNKQVTREILCAQAQKHHRDGQLKGVCTVSFYTDENFVWKVRYLIFFSFVFSE